MNKPTEIGKGTIRLVALSILVFLAMSFSGAAAVASTSHDVTAQTERTQVLAAGPDPSTQGGPDSATCGGNANGQAWNPYLAVDRWNGATSMLHTRLKDIFEMNGVKPTFNNPVAHLTNGAIDGFLLSVGNWATQVNVGLAREAEQFCTIGTFGGAVDKTAGDLGKMLFDFNGTGGIAFVILVGGIIIVIWRASRSVGNGGGDVGKYLLKAASILALASIMITGASHTSNQQATGDTTHFGHMSPGWFMNVLNKTTTQVAQFSTKGWDVPGNAWYVTDSKRAGEPTGPGTCPYMLDQMHKKYHDVPNASQTANALSQMYENSGMLLWARTQFGSGMQEPAVARSFCFIADGLGGVQGSTKGVTPPTAETAYPGGGSKTFDPGATTEKLSGLRGVSQAYFDAMSDTPYTGEYAQAKPQKIDTTQEWFKNRNDIGGLTYAACVPNGGGWKVDTIAGMEVGSKGSGKGHRINADDCMKSFSGHLPNDDDGEGALNVRPGTEQDIDPSPTGLSDFVGHWHGVVDNGTSLLAAFSYTIACLAMLVVFGAISIGVLVAKVIMIVSAIFVFFLLLLELNPNGESRLPNFAKFLVSMTLASIGLSLVLGIIGKVTWFVSTAATSIAGNGTVFSMMCYAFSPLVAAFIVHMIFTHVLKLPSPVKMNSAMQYAERASSLGGSAADGLSSFGNYVKNRAAFGAGRKALRMAGAGAMGAAGGLLGSKAASKGSGGGSGEGSSEGRGSGSGGNQGSAGATGGGRGNSAKEAALRRQAKEAEKTGDGEFKEEGINKAKQAWEERQPARGFRGVKERMGQSIQEHGGGFRGARGAAWSGAKTRFKERTAPRLAQTARNMLDNPLRTTLRGVGKTAKVAGTVGLAAGLIGATGGAGTAIVGAAVARRLAQKGLARHDENKQKRTEAWESSSEFAGIQNAAKRATGRQTGEARKQFFPSEQERKNTNEGSGSGGTPPGSSESGAGAEAVKRNAAKKKNEEKLSNMKENIPQPNMDLPDDRKGT